MNQQKFIVSILACLAISASCTMRQNADSEFFKIILPTLEHESFSLKRFSENKASVIIFLQPECPFCNSYGQTLRELDSVLKMSGVKIYGVVAGKFYPDSEINDYRTKFQLQFPFLLDPEFVLRKNLNASVTPQAYLIDANGNTVYHGMIDNWGYEIGKARAHATEFYLKDAVTNLLSGRKIIEDSTKAIGCYIQ